MKKIFFILTIIVTHVNCHCQEFKGGIILGLSTSQVSGDDLAGFNKAGLVFGGFTNRILSSRISNDKFL